MSLLSPWCAFTGVLATLLCATHALCVFTRGFARSCSDWTDACCIREDTKAPLGVRGIAVRGMEQMLPAAHVHTNGGIRQANTAIVRSLSVMTLTAFPTTTLKGASSRTTASKGCTFICFTQHVASSLWHGMRHARVCLAVS